MEVENVPEELDPSSIDTFYEALGHIRDALIRHVGEDFLTQKQIVMEVFNSLDVDQDRILTATELAEFMRSPELGLLDQIDAPDAEQYAKLFVGYIDRNK
ncbi:hypothetical protein EON65_25435 [archaeon]|nr:MAG: hypothetical protein EON65_25435 [archaeon]